MAFTQQDASSVKNIELNVYTKQTYLIHNS